MPLDISYDTYKDMATSCMQLVKGQPRNLSERHDLELQNELVQIMHAVRDTVPENVREHLAEGLKPKMYMPQY